MTEREYLIVIGGEPTETIRAKSVLMAAVNFIQRFPKESRQRLQRKGGIVIGRVSGFAFVVRAA